MNEQGHAVYASRIWRQAIMFLGDADLIAEKLGRGVALPESHVEAVRACTTRVLTMLFYVARYHGSKSHVHRVDCVWDYYMRERDDITTATVIDLDNAVCYRCSTFLLLRSVAKELARAVDSARSVFLHHPTTNDRRPS